MDYQDILGTPISVGSFVAYAVSRGHSGELRIGLVTELTAKKRRYSNSDDTPAVKMRILSNRYGMEQLHVSTRTTDLDELVVLANVPDRIANFLRSNDKDEKVVSAQSSFDVHDVD